LWLECVINCGGQFSSASGGSGDPRPVERFLMRVPRGALALNRLLLVVVRQYRRFHADRQFADRAGEGEQRLVVTVVDRRTSL
jgi:hypothetical protein